MMPLRKESWRPAPPSLRLVHEARELPPILSADYGEKAEYHERTEDAFINDPEHGIFAVFDGVGGAPGGDRAAFLAKMTFEIILQNVKQDATLDEAIFAMNRATKAANALIRQEAAADPKRSRMETTVVATRLWRGPNGETKLIIESAGDSRAYAFHPNKTHEDRLEMLTLDDSTAFPADDLNFEREKLELQKKLSSTTLPGYDLTPEELKHFEQRNFITRCLGMKDLKSTTFVLDIEPSATVLLVSDGISDNLTTEEIRSILSRAKDPHTAAFRLVQEAVARSKEGMNARSKPDDMTVVMFVVPITK